jgi:anoctamin-8
MAHENSLIYKNVFFKFINSYMPIIYMAFFKNGTDLKDIFYLMLPVLIVK